MYLVCSGAQACPPTMYPHVHTVTPLSRTKAAACASDSFARPRAGLSVVSRLSRGKIERERERGAHVHYTLALTCECTGNYAVRSCMEIAYGENIMCARAACVFIVFDSSTRANTRCLAFYPPMFHSREMFADN